MAYHSFQVRGWCLAAAPPHRFNKFLFPLSQFACFRHSHYSIIVNTKIYRLLRIRQNLLKSRKNYTNIILEHKFHSFPT